MILRSRFLVAIVALSAMACPGSPPRVQSRPPTTKVAEPAEKVVWQKSKSGLGFRLSDADPERPERAKLAPAKPLDDAAAKQVLARMPRMSAAAEKRPYAARSKSLPPPRPGETIKTEFPPPVAPSGPPPRAASGPLQVVRRAPEGNVPIAPNLAVTFSEPMVAVTSHTGLASDAVPVRVRPEPPGKWRWIGTQTVFFEPEGERFPMATRYTVEIPASAKSAAGNALKEALSWVFETPRLDVEQVHPRRYGPPSDLEPVVFASFNQRIDRQALLAHVELRSARGKHAVRLATEDEIEKDEDVRRLSREARPDRWIALKPVEPLPKGSEIAFIVKAGAPSAEGPLTTEREQRELFRVRGPLRLEEVRCGWYDGCPPLSPFTIRLSNPIDDGAFDPSQVEVVPELPGTKIDVSGSTLVVRGRSKGRTRYTIKLGAAIKDVFGQTLEQPATGTVDVGEAEPYLFREQSDMILLDPAFEPKLSVYSVNRTTLNVRLYAVDPSDWDRYVKFRRDYDWDGRVTTPPGKQVLSRTITPRGERDSLVETQIDLKPFLRDGAGQLVAIVEPPNQPVPKNRWEYRERQWVRTWVQVTKLGLTAMRDAEDAVAWVTDLATGAPVSGASVSVLPGGAPAQTGADGLAKLSLGSKGDQLVARKGSDLVFVPGTVDSGTFVAHPRSDALRWFVFDDRHLYKPGERVNVKGWVRIAGTGKAGDLGRLRGGRHEVAFKVFDPRGSELAKGTAPLDDSDGFHLSFGLPDNANLGPAHVELTLDGGGWDQRTRHTFRIEEFRRPEFEVSAQASEGPHFVGKHALATVAATYFAGGGLPHAEVRWTVRAEDAAFAPPNRAGWHFGKARPFWWWAQDDDAARRATETWKAKTDSEGRHRLRIDFDALEPAYPRHLALEANVTDVNRQSWSARTSLLVHPASVTVGLRRESQILKAGSNVQLDVIVTDLEGRAVAGRTVSVKSVRIERTWRGRKSQEREVDPETCTVSSGTEPVRCSLPTRAGGEHRITAIVHDVHGRPSQTELEVWVLGEEPPNNPTVRSERADVIADKTDYRPGEAAELLVAAPFAPAEGVLTIRRDGIVKVQRFRLEKKTATLRVDIDPAWVPNAIAHVDLVGARTREAENGEPDESLPKRPAVASGEVTLVVPPRDRTLYIEVVPDKKALEPRGTTNIAVEVRDPAGEPVPNAAVALVVVDESVLALAGYELPDPIEVLYPKRGAGVAQFEMRMRLALSRPDTARAELKAKGDKKSADKNGHAPGMDRGIGFGGIGTIGHGSGRAKPMRVEALAAPAPTASEARSEAPPPPPTVPPPAGEAAPAIQVRTDFDPLAAFVPRLTTDARGRAVASVRLPDNLTRYRVTAVAAAGDKAFGRAESDVTARLPLMVRPSAPRFLNFGDRFALPVVLQNQTTQPLMVDVVARADNARLFEPDALRVEVPANDRVEVRFPAAAAEPGTARVQIGAVSRAGADAAEIELPVWTPATSEAFATYGAVDRDPIAQPVRMPSNVFAELGQLEVTTSSTAVQGLTDAVLYLVRYPFDCNEQIASRTLAIAALRDVLAAFEAPGLPPKETLLQTVAADVEQLARRQHHTGGWDYWRKDRQPDPFVSIHVANALVRAKAKGFLVRQDVLARALSYARNIQQHFPPWYGTQARRTVRAYALSVRARAGHEVDAEARALLKEAGGPNELTMDAVGWLLSVLSKAPNSTAEVEAIRRHLDNRIAETAGKAHFVASVSDDAHVILESSRRTDGILLEAMIEDRPAHDALPKLAQGLLAHRVRGRWRSTQENVFVLLALDRYFQAFEKATPDFVARAWLGPELAAEHAFRGRSVDRKHVDIPLSVLAQREQPGAVVLAKDGTGRLYYRIGMSYVPKDLRPPPVEHGFAVSRLYEGADDPGDVRRDPDGTWRIKLGSRVRVRLAMVAPARRYHVALVDPIPAGFEAQSSALAMTPSVPRDPKLESSKSPWWWASAWYEHQNLRDERVEAFTSLLYGGTYDYSYVARATTPGDFVVPPPRAEEMYDPETFGRGAGDRVVIE